MNHPEMMKAFKDIFRIAYRVGEDSMLSKKRPIRPFDPVAMSSNDEIDREAKFHIASYLRQREVAEEMHNAIPLTDIIELPKPKLVHGFTAPGRVADTLLVSRTDARDV